MMDAVLKLMNDSDPFVRFQLALSLGESKDIRSGEALGKLAANEMGDAWMRAAILSSATRQPAEILKAVLAADAKKPGRTTTISQLIATAAGGDNPEALGKIIITIAPVDDNHLGAWQLTALNSLLDALDRKKVRLPALAQNSEPAVREAIQRFNLLFDWANRLAIAPETKDSLREPAIRLLGRNPERLDADLQLLARLLDSSVSEHSQQVTLDTLKPVRVPQVPVLLLDGWKLRTPSLRQAIIQVLLSRDEWVKALLGALDSGTIGNNEISPANRQHLLKHSDKDIQSRA